MYSSKSEPYCELWYLVIILQCWFISCNKCTTVVVNVDNGESMETHSSTLAWEIPWTEEPGRLQSMGWQRVGYD